MQYETLLNYIKSYIAVIYAGCNLKPHKHYEAELIYCISGCVHFTIDQKKYDLYPNQMILINSVSTHSSYSDVPETNILLLKVGPAFLKETFLTFAKVQFQNPILSLENSFDDWQKKTKALLDELYTILQTKNSNSDLLVQSNLYRLCAYIIELYQNNAHMDIPQYHSYIAVKKIEDVFQYVFNNYYEQITVDDAAQLSGYTKEYFCKIFKQLSGETFHQFLTRVRMEQAKFLLANTTLSINEIASTVGITEHKTFRFAFKNFTSLTPTEYRKKHTAD